MPDYDIPENCWESPRTYSSAEVGDVFDGVPLSRLDHTFELISPARGEVAVPVIFALGLVVGLYEEFAILAPITTKRDVSDPDAYDRLVESGRVAEKFARLPSCAGVFPDPAMVSFFMPSTLPLPLLQDLHQARVKAMTPEAQAILRSRFARAHET